MPSADWTAQNPILAQFEEGTESDTGKVKRGPGAWNDLGYYNPFGVASAAAITAEIEAAVAALVGGAPGALDTLNELAAALADDAAFSTTVTNALAALRGGPALVAADQTARLALTGLAVGAQVKQTDNGFVYTLTNAAAPSDAASWQAIPKVYEVLLSQADTDAPVPVVLDNSLGAAVWSRVSTGIYRLTLAGAFPADRVYVNPRTGYLSVADAHVFYISRIDDNIMQLSTEAAEVVSDDMLFGTAFGLKTYPA
jgi:hypothetical protein